MIVLSRKVKREAKNNDKTQELSESDSLRKSCKPTLPVSRLSGIQRLHSKRHQLSFCKHCAASVAPCFFAVCARRQAGFPVLASGSNCAVKPTRLRRAAYFRR